MPFTRIIGLIKGQLNKHMQMVCLSLTARLALDNILGHLSMQSLRGKLNQVLKSLNAVVNYNWAFELPPFMINSYFCDTGDLNRTSIESMVYSNKKPLWEGRGCGPNSSCCQFNSPPWFCTTLPEPTSDDLEFRIMLSESYFDEDVFVSLIDVYIQK